MPTIKEQIEQISDLLKADALIAFVGAGFSANVGNYPLWREFIAFLETDLNKDNPNRDTDPIKFAEVLDSKDPDNVDPAEAALFYCWQKGRSAVAGGSTGEMLYSGKEAFRDVVFKKFEAPDWDQSEYEQHVLLVKKFKKIFTTNWDILLEIACDNSGADLRFERVFAPTQQYKGPMIGKYEQCSFPSPHVISDQTVRIVKFHGCQTDRTGTSIIASSADYYERVAESSRHPLDQELLWDMENKGVLFIGYSLSDLNVNYILNQMHFKFWRRNIDDGHVKNYFLSIDNPDYVTLRRLEYLDRCKNIETIFLCEADHPLHKIDSKTDEAKKLMKKALTEFLKMI